MVQFTSSLLLSKGWRQTLQYTSLLQVLGLSLCVILIRNLYTFRHATTTSNNSNIKYELYSNAKMLLKDRHFFYLALGYMVSFLGYMIPLVHLPTFALQHGLSSQQASLLLSVIGTIRGV